MPRLPPASAAWAAALLMGLSCAPTAERTASTMNEEKYEQDLQQIQAACQSGDLDEIEKTLEQIDKEWARPDPISHVNLSRAACDEMASQTFEDKQRGRDLLERRALLALKKADETQMNVQLHLLTSYLRVHEKMATMKVADWPQERRASAELWFGVWKRLEGLIDPDWDPSDPKNEVKPFEPPEGKPGPPGGAAPEAIQDPELRAQYEAHQKKNAELTARNQQQHRLRKAREDYAEDFEQYIISLYTMSPFNTPELKAQLAGLKDEAMSKRILDAVAEKEKAAGGG